MICGAFALCVLFIDCCVGLLYVVFVLCVDVWLVLLVALAVGFCMMRLRCVGVLLVYFMVFVFADLFCLFG